MVWIHYATNRMIYEVGTTMIQCIFKVTLGIGKASGGPLHIESNRINIEITIQ
ncbi:hypothetical protein [Neobacillus sp. FSL H8-0543]|uniref:hypothetical protein n=1 Tax=Neobacillus sp. FSL H8-0543 TaxID=2954672 RepID=UPI0031592245